MLQWQTAMERLKHFEALVATGLGLYLAALAYAVTQVLAKSQNPTERDYWSVVFFMMILCICQLHVVERVNDAAVGVVQLERNSRGSLTYLSDVTRRITWSASLGFLTTFVAPAVSVLCIIFGYRQLSSSQILPPIAMVVSGLVFLNFAVALLRQQRMIIATVTPKTTVQNELMGREKPRTSNCPFLLKILGVIAALAGVMKLLAALIVVTKTFVLGAEPDFGLRISKVLEGVSVFAALLVGYAILKERAWGRPALVAYLVLNTLTMGWLESASVASLAGAMLGLAFCSWYLYLWPNTTNYYRHLRESGDSRGKPPNSGLPADA